VAGVTGGADRADGRKNVRSFAPLGPIIRQMSFKNLDVGAAMQRLAERKIEQAMRDGKFDNIEGSGKPLDLEPLPADENARMRWWALKILKQNDITPDEVRWRKEIDRLREQLDAATTEERVKVLVSTINGLVRKVNTLGTNALPVASSTVSLDAELEKLRGRVSALPVASEATHSALRQPTEPAMVPGDTRRSAPPRAPGWLPGLKIRTCGNGACRTRNPGLATFCRRCGQAL
jgi:hypothetical protein